MVLSKVRQTPRPRNRATASQDPSISPRPQASRHAVALTASDRPTMVHKAGSLEVINSSAVTALCVNVDMIGYRRRRGCNYRDMNNDA